MYLKRFFFHFLDNKKILFTENSSPDHEQESLSTILILRHKKKSSLVVSDVRHS